MTLAPLDIDAAANNPLDILEELVVANEWPFDRSSSDEMVVEATGRWCDYRMFFVWREDVHALYFTCAFDMRIPENRHGARIRPWLARIITAEINDPSAAKTRT